jgi:hypothetical protein
MGDPYSRVYWSVMSDPKFDPVRDDARLLGSWLILLLAADMAYPGLPYRPPTVSAQSMRALVASGLIDDLPKQRYRIHGLAYERERRKQSARNAAAMRWQSERNAVASATKMPSKAEQSKAEQTRGMRPHNSVERDPLLRQIREVYQAKDKKGDA